MSGAGALDARSLNCCGDDGCELERDTRDEQIRELTAKVEDYATALDAFALPGAEEKVLDLLDKRRAEVARLRRELVEAGNTLHAGAAHIAALRTRAETAEAEAARLREMLERCAAYGCHNHDEIDGDCHDCAACDAQFALAQPSPSAPASPAEGQTVVSVDDGKPGGDHTAYVTATRHADGSVTVDDVEITPSPACETCGGETEVPRDIKLVRDGVSAKTLPKYERLPCPTCGGDS